ncbi:hypothetical protein [Bradyrhizobium sp.]|jgi:hypothetical protein|nr:hypothetical protein [Bradyrhizobium sp.]HEV2155429.1 hypothetical protein [Bradyrhizobium sp.]
MILWLIIVGLLLALLMLPARAFGWLCGQAARILVRDRKPPLPPPIDPR